MTTDIERAANLESDNRRKTAGSEERPNRRANTRAEHDRLVRAEPNPEKAWAKQSKLEGLGRAAASEAVKRGLSGGPGDDLSAGSMVGGAALLVEAAEDGLTEPANIEDRMDRFPELRDVELPTGNVARFPELAEQPVPAPQEPEQDEGYRR